MTPTNDLPALPTFDIREPVEITIRHQHPGKAPWQPDYILVGYVADNGMVVTGLSHAGSSIPQSLINLQSDRTYPRKAVEGWQAQLVDFAAGAIGKVVKVQ